MFQDNKYIVDSSMTLYTKIYKRYILLSFYYVREEILAKIISYYFIPGEINSTDILSKYWGYAQV